MQFIAQDVVLLDPWRAVAADYREFAPLRAAFSLAKPYQAHKTDGRTRSSPIDAAAAGELVAAPAAGGAAEAAPAAPSDAAGQPEAKRRRKARSSSFQPNERQQESAQRHAEYAPQLVAAADAVQAWLGVSGAAAVQQALDLALAAAEVADEHAQQHSHAPAAGHHPTQEERAGQQQQQQQRQCAEGEQQKEEGVSSGEEGEEPDYLAMADMRHALKPKLQFLAPETTSAAAAADAGDVPGAGSCQQQGVQQQQQQQQTSCNLFNQLIDSSSSGSDGRERLALAGGHPVLLPPRCRFLMSDARQLQPLLPGTGE
jgi:hypothetical protein